MPSDVTAAHALVYTGPGQAALETVDPNTLGVDGPCVDVATRFTGLSRGTERLVFQGKVPEAEFDRMRAPMQVGVFPFPVRYGYSAVGTAQNGPLAGQTVFALHPHQDHFRIPADRMVPVPDSVPAGRAILAANMETALNALWDARVSPGMRCLVVGLGMVGWLVTALLSRRLDLLVDVTDVRTPSGINADDFGVRFLKPTEVAAHGYDIAFHCAAAPAGLQSAIDALDFEGKVIELSWYGDRPVPVILGGNFHANRLSIVSSQVGHVAPVRRPTTDYRRRLLLALDALDDPRLDALITEEVVFRDLPGALPRLLAADAPGIATRIAYRD